MACCKLPNLEEFQISQSREEMGDEESMMEQHYRVTITENRAREVGIAALDEFESTLYLSQFSDSQTFIHAYTKLHIYNPVEIIVPGGNAESELQKFIRARMPGSKVSLLPRIHFSESEGITDLKKYALHESFSVIESEVSTKYLALASAAALFKYLNINQTTEFAPNSLQVIYTGSTGTMMMDAETIKNLELISSVRTDNRKNSLFGVINRTKTAQGSRMLIKNLVQPPADLETITLRHEAVEEIVGQEQSFFEISNILKRFRDLSRLVSQLIRVPKTTAMHTRDFQSAILCVVNLKESLEVIPKIAECMGLFKNLLLKAIRDNFTHKSLNLIQDEIDKVISPNTNWSKNAIMLQTQICFAVKASLSDLLDVARKTYQETRQDILNLLSEYQEEHGMPNMKMSFSSKRWFYLSIPVDKTLALPKSFTQVTKTKKKILFSTIELTSLNAKNKHAYNEVLLESSSVVAKLFADIRVHIGVIHKLCESVATLDLLFSSAEYSSSATNCVRPHVTIEGPIAIREGRHPMLEQLQNRTVTPNDMFISETMNFQLITGPNMSGKSTYIRQAALLIIMAQVGYFVPAFYASLRIVDRLMTHLSTSDTLETNSSSFMNEMKSMNFILRNATSRSLVIVDELGRGTSPIDGAAIAFAIAEHLMQLKAYTYFVTHFLELNQLAELYPCVRIYHFKENDLNDTTTLMYTISEGYTTDSNYGIDIAAKRAGVQKEIIQHAMEFKEQHLQSSTTTHQTREGRPEKLPEWYNELAAKLRALKNSSLGPNELRDYLVSLQKQYKDKQ